MSTKIELFSHIDYIFDNFCNYIPIIMIKKRRLSVSYYPGVKTFSARAAGRSIQENGK